jgi:beta-phosphoglucomutase-like phosphatase (HAD superfamily)
LEAVIFDVDGTLYNQVSVRYGMFWRILRAYLGEPAEGVLTLRILKAYRKAQEFLRSAEPDWDDVAEAQIELASKWTGIPKEIVGSSVARWMEKEPLDLVARSIRQGVLEFLQEAKNCGLRLAVFSDYPAVTKLQAMNLTHFFEIVVSACDPEVQRFKPDSRGIQVTLQRLRVEKNRAIYIGDRPTIDAVAAFRAGISCVIIGGKGDSITSLSWTQVPGYRELLDLVCRS